MNFFKYGKTIVNIDNIAYCEFDDDVLSIAFAGDGADSDWGLTLEGDAARALVEHMESVAHQATKVGAIGQEVL